jgi:hypothetical protein
VTAWRQHHRNNALAIVHAWQVYRPRVDTDIALPDICDCRFLRAGLDDAAPRDLEREPVVSSLAREPQEVESKRIEERQVPVLRPEVDDSVDARRIDAKLWIFERTLAPAGGR